MNVISAPIPTVPPVLEGRFVRLEPLRRDHLSGLEAFALDPDLWRFTSSRIETSADLARYIDTALVEQERGASLPFATVLRSDNRLVGGTRFGSIARDQRRVEIGWTVVGRPWQRTAVNTEAKYLMLRAAFEDWGCQRVELKTSSLNLRSRAAIRRLGAVEEGTLRSHMFNGDGTRRDTVYFSVLDSEWPAVRARLEGFLAR